MLNLLSFFYFSSSLYKFIFVINSIKKSHKTHIKQFTLKKITHYIIIFNGTIRLVYNLFLHFCKLLLIFYTNKIVSSCLSWLKIYIFINKTFIMKQKKITDWNYVFVFWIKILWSNFFFKFHIFLDWLNFRQELFWTYIINFSLNMLRLWFFLKWWNLCACNFWLKNFIEFRFRLEITKIIKLDLFLVETLLKYFNFSFFLISINFLPFLLLNFQMDYLKKSQTLEWN